MFLFSLLLACSTAPQPSPATTPTTAPSNAVRSIDLATFKNDFFAKKVPVLIDVRTPTEYQGGHVPGAISIPLDQIEGRKAELDTYKNQEIYLICESGGRSGHAAQLLSTQGFSTVNIQGGTYAWRNAELPLNQGDTP